MVALAPQVATDIGHDDLVRIVIKKDVHSIQMHSATITYMGNCIFSSTTPCKSNFGAALATALKRWGDREAARRGELLTRG